MMKKSHTLLSLFFLTALPFFITSPLAQEQEFYDLFTGMLEHRNGELIFVNCKTGSDAMRVKFAPQHDIVSVKKALDAMQNHSVVQVTAFAQVHASEGTGYSYDIFIREFDSISVKKSCHLLDFFEK